SKSTVQVLLTSANIEQLCNAGLRHFRVRTAAAGSGEYLQKGGRRNFLNVFKVIYGEGCENDKMTSSGSTGAGADFHASAQAAIRGFASLI
ncbi:hypothetical protein, partial [Cloacibacillus porcorum]|uniref:hypothetical protein n=1 Tax=Cloacibacillus porcorum TaxID=1197717 RepID=UPI0022E49E9F